VPYASDIDYVRLSERYEARPAGTLRGATRLIGRWTRTDAPYQSPAPGFFSSAGRSTWSFDGSTVMPDAR
jgi:hypothetical protein